MVPQLRKFFTTITKNAGTGDARQIPASDAIVTVYKQGATVVDGPYSISPGANAVIKVSDPGAFVVGAQVSLNSDSTVVATVANPPSRRYSTTGLWTDWANTSYPGEIELTNVSGTTALNLATGDRLVYQNSTPTLYSDAHANNSLGQVYAEADTQGNVSFYTPERYFDYRVSGTGVTTTLFENGESGWHAGDMCVHNAKDYPSIQAAIDALPEGGGVVYIPAGEYDISGTLYTPTDRPCHLIGDGFMYWPHGATGAGIFNGTILRWETTSDMLRVRGNDSSVQKMTLWNKYNNPASSQWTGRGITIGRRNVTNPHPHPGQDTTAEITFRGQSLEVMRSITIKDVSVIASPGFGICIPGFADDEPDHVDGVTLAIMVDLNNVMVKNAQRYGQFYVGGGCTTIHCTGCMFLGGGIEEVPYPDSFVWIYRAQGTTFTNCAFEGLAAGRYKPHVKLDGARGTSFKNCWFESYHNYQDTITYPVDANCGYLLSNSGRDNGYSSAWSTGTTVDGCHFARNAGPTGIVRMAECTTVGSESDANSGVWCLNFKFVNNTFAAQYYLKSGVSHNTGWINNPGGYYEHVRLNGAIGAKVDTVMMDDWGGQWPCSVDYANSAAINDVVWTKLPGLAASDATGVQFGDRGQPMGCISWDWDLTTAGNNTYGWPRVYTGAWRLINSPPRLDSATIAARNQYFPWQIGDIVYNTSASSTHELQMCTATGAYPTPATWKYIALTATP